MTKLLLLILLTALVLFALAGAFLQIVRGQRPALLAPAYSAGARARTQSQRTSP